MLLTTGVSERQKLLKVAQTLLRLRLPVPGERKLIWHLSGWRQRTSTTESVFLSCSRFLESMRMSVETTGG